MILDVKIDDRRLRQLLKDSALLEQLRANGVDNWCGWGENESDGESASEYADRLDEMTSERLIKEI